MRTALNLASRGLLDRGSKPVLNTAVFGYLRYEFKKQEQFHSGGYFIPSKDGDLKKIKRRWVLALYLEGYL